MSQSRELFANARQNVENARADVILAQRKLAILERKMKLDTIFHYVKRLDAHFQSGTLDYSRSANRLLDAVILKFERFPFPPLSEEQLNNVLDTYDQDTSTVSETLVESLDLLNESRHQANNALIHHFVLETPGVLEDLPFIGVNHPTELLSMPNEVCDVAMQLVQHHSDTLTSDARREFNELADSLEPLMTGEDTVF